MHECPFCYAVCMCRGDIDDIVLDTPDDCIHIFVCDLESRYPDDDPLFFLDDPDFQEDFRRAQAKKEVDECISVLNVARIVIVSRLRA